MTARLTFPSTRGGAAIRAAGTDAKVGSCYRGHRAGWTAVLYAVPDRPGTGIAEPYVLDRRTLTELREAIRQRLERYGRWWQ